MSLMWIAVAAGCAWLAGAVLHELTHLAVAWWFDASPRLDIIGMDVYFTTDGLARWQHRAIMLAPQTIGGVVAATALLAGVTPSMALVPVAAGWTAYTLMGGVADLSLRVSRGEPTTRVASDVLGLDSVPPGDRDSILLLLVALNVMLVGGVAQRLVSDASGSVGTFLYWLGAPFVIAVGAGLLFAAVLRRDTAPTVGH